MRGVRCVNTSVMSMCICVVCALRDASLRCQRYCVCVALRYAQSCLREACMRCKLSEACVRVACCALCGADCSVSALSLRSAAHCCELIVLRVALHYVVFAYCNHLIWDQVYKRNMIIYTKKKKK